MKLFVIAVLAVLPTVASAQVCKMELYGPRNEFITSVRMPQDPYCQRALQACRNWSAWYIAPASSQCYHVRDDGYAVIDYVRFPDYDRYYGYRGSPYTRVPQTQPDVTETTTTTICEYDQRGRERCRTLPPTTSTRPARYQPGSTTEVCDYYDDGSRECRTIYTSPGTRPETRPNPTTPTPMPRPRPETNPAPRPNTNPTPVPIPRPRPETNPQPTPTPVPTPVPVPLPAPGTDSVRPIEAGETVIFNNALHMVVSVENTNFYNLKPVEGRNRDTIKNVARQYVAVTRGCQVGFCANDSVIVLPAASYEAVAGIEYDGQLVTKTVDGENKMTFDVNANTLAWTKGCTPEGSHKVCVGNVVMRGRIYYTVVGVQLDGNAVIENNDGPKKLMTNVIPSSLLIVNNR